MARKKKRKKRRDDDVKVIDVSEDELAGLCERANQSLDEKDAQLLQNIVSSYVHVENLVRMKETDIRRLRRLFGVSFSSEKTQNVLASVDSDTTSKSSPDESAAAEQPTGEESDKAGGAETEKKKGHGRNGVNDYAGAERTPVRHATLKAGDACPKQCGGKVYLWKDAKNIIRIYGQSPIAAQIFELETFRCNGCLEIFTAEAPAEVISNKKYDESAAAVVALLHYGMGTPFYRLEQLQASAKVPFPASTQWEVVSGYFPMLQPVFGAMVKLAADGELLHNDDTMARILSLMGKQREKKLAKGTLDKPDRTGIFTTGILGHNGPHKVALFYTGRDHAGENIAKVLAERDKGLGPPIQMSDGLAANVCHMFEVLHANCLSHGRRLWVDQVANFPAECKFLLETLGKVFHHEKLCKERALSVEERLTYHQEHSKPLMDKLKEWMDDLIRGKKIEPNSSLGDPINYMTKRWDKLTLFLTVAGAPLDNNIVERALKKSILQRKNSLFFKTEYGAKVGSLYTTLIYTAEINNVDPLDYLTALLRHPDQIADDPSQWLPRTYKASLESLTS